eukprot:393208-Rhodomonas_salina.1
MGQADRIGSTQGQPPPPPDMAFHSQHKAKPNAKHHIPGANCIELRFLEQDVGCTPGRPHARCPGLVLWATGTAVRLSPMHAIRRPARLRGTLSA